MNIVRRIVVLSSVVSMAIPSFRINAQSIGNGDLPSTGTSRKRESPTYSRTLSFSGVEWGVRSGFGGPGPNPWSDDPQSVWVDALGALHLRIRHVDTTWYCAEVFALNPTPYGVYRFYLIGRLDSLDRNVVFSPFLYRNDSTEIDIEFSTWGNSQTDTNAQYVIQPGRVAGNLSRFPIRQTGGYTTHSIDWESDSITFESVYGHYRTPPDSSHLVRPEWVYKGGSIPLASSNLAVHMNLWLYRGKASSNGEETEIIVSNADVPSSTAGVPEVSTSRTISLFQNFPNPFNPTTGIRYSVPSSTGRDGQVSGNSVVRLVVYDVMGREVAVLVNGQEAPGTHEVRFDGSRLASGVYFYQLRAGSLTETKSMMVVK